MTEKRWPEERKGGKGNAESERAEGNLVDFS